jgi:SAM-dependent methyltransferase
MQNVPPPDVPPFGAMLARAYQSHWRNHSEQLLTTYPKITDRFGINGTRLVDIACGEGTFAVGMAKKGWDVTGVDLSRDMLALALARAVKDGVTVNYVPQDMRHFKLPEPVDVASCWFNSLNYLLTEDNLRLALQHVRAALVNGGWFLFDAYTLHGLSVDWETRAWIAVDELDCYITADTKWFPDEMVATVHFTGFIEEDGCHHRFDEYHRNRGYTWECLQNLLTESGFAHATAFTLPGIQELDRKTIRMFVAAQADG